MIQRTKLKLVIYIILLIIAIGVLIWWSLLNSAKGRDYKRLADIKLVEAEMIDYFLRFNTYQIPGCMENSLVHYCIGVEDRSLNFSGIIDPKNKGTFQYIISGLSDNDFTVSFSLERGVGRLEKGSYILSREGIRQ